MYYLFIKRINVRGKTWGRNKKKGLLPNIINAIIGQMQKATGEFWEENIKIDHLWSLQKLGYRNNGEDGIGNPYVNAAYARALSILEAGK